MVDSERIIMVIEKYPCIWNTSLQDYQKKHLKDLSWNSVCSELIEDWIALSPEKKNTKLNDIKKRWTNIRDYYKKEIEQQKKPGTGKPGKKRKKYVFAGILDFLRPVFERRNTSGNYENSDEHEIATSQSAETDSEFIATTTSATESLSTTIITTSTPPICPANPKSKKTLGKLNAFERSIIKALENKATTADVPGPRQCPVEDDPDLMFLKSLLPDLKDLTSSQKFDFKIGIMQLLRSIRNSVPESPSDSHIYDPINRPNHQQNTQFDTPFQRSMTAVSTPAFSPRSTLMHSPNSHASKFEAIYNSPPAHCSEEQCVVPHVKPEEMDSTDASNDMDISDLIKHENNRELS